MNKIFLIGNLTKAPELRSTQTGVPVCTFSLAVNRRFTGQDGERETDFINVVAWRGLAETCAKFLDKGKKAAVCGALQTRAYADKEGHKRTIYEVVADDVEFLTPKDRQSDNEFSGFAEMNESDLPF